MKHIHIITGIVCLFFLISVFAFLTGYHRYEHKQAMLEALKQQTRLVRRQRQEYEDKLDKVLQVNAFVNSAKEMGLERSKWDVYDVNIEGGYFTFREMEQIINQCVNGSSYYFKPLAFQLNPTRDRSRVEIAVPEEKNKKKSRGKKKPAEKVRTATTVQKITEEDKKDKDVQLTLRGAFFVRQN